MVNALISFLEKYRINPANKGEKPHFTHTSMGNPVGSFAIPDEKREELHKLICDMVYINKEPVHLTECPYPMKPITVDLDFRFELDDSERQYNLNHIKGIVELYNEAIRMYVDLERKGSRSSTDIDRELEHKSSDGDDGGDGDGDRANEGNGIVAEIRAFVFERDSPRPFKGNYKDGIHIIYPDIVIDTTIQHLIRNHVLSKFSSVFESSIYGKLPLKNSPEDVIDKAVISKNNWLLYGCSKPQYPPYSLTHIFKSCADPDTGVLILKEIPNKYSHYELINLLSTHKMDKKDLQYDLRAECKLDYQAELNKDKNRTKKPITMTKTHMFTKPKRKVYAFSEKNSTKLDEVRNLVKLLAQYRTEEYPYWIEVGWCLHNINDSLLDCWIEFSKRSAKFTAGECERLWSEFEDKGLGLGSLHRWARMDNPDEYKQLRRNFIGAHIHKSISGTTQDVAHVVHHMYQYNFVCVSIKNNIWYEFRNHRWYLNESGISLKANLATDVLEEYLSLITHHNISAIHTDTEQKDQALYRAKALTDVTYKIRDITFKEKVMKECAIMFYDETFVTELDTNPYLVGFENGVYDLSTGTFRDGRPEDKLSFSTYNDYKEFNDDDEQIENIYTFLSQVFPKVEVREYVLLLLSSFLQGQNPSEKFHIWTGSGGNGKSKLLELFEMAFGDYCVKFPVTLLTGKRAASSAAQPELRRTKGKRFGSFQEPDDESKINVGLMKELTGGDKILVRDLYEKPIEFKPQFKLILCCNKLPKVPPDDEAVWRRLEVVEFIAKFVSNPDPSNPYEFPRDEYLSQKLVSWKEAFMAILLQYYKKFRNEGLRAPADVTKATTEYQKQSDVYVEFKEEMFIRDQTKNSLVKLDESYTIFKQWYKNNFDSKPPPRKEYKCAMEKKSLFGSYGRGSKQGWWGWKLATENISEPDNNYLRLEAEEGEMEEIDVGEPAIARTIAPDLRVQPLPPASATKPKMSLIIKNKSAQTPVRSELVTPRKITSIARTLR